jgi:hypothetical protein
VEKVGRQFFSQLASGLPDRAPTELWIIDESSLLGTRQMNALLHKAREAGAGRVVFVGFRLDLLSALRSDQCLWQQAIGGLFVVT